MAIAKQIGAYPADFSRWVSGKRPVPVEFCVAIEKATFGAVTRQSLYGAGWQSIWPELAKKSKKAA